MASQPMGFLDLPKDIRLLVYEYLPLEIRHVYLDAFVMNDSTDDLYGDSTDDLYGDSTDDLYDNPTDEFDLAAEEDLANESGSAIEHRPKERQRGGFVALLYRVPPINICLTCKTINHEASALFKDSKSYKHKIESYTIHYPPQIIEHYTFKTHLRVKRWADQLAMVNQIMCNLVSISWNVLVRHEGQREKIHAAPASEFGLPICTGFSVPGRGHLQFLRQLSLYLLEKFWGQEGVPTDVTDDSKVAISRVALRPIKAKPDASYWRRYLHRSFYHGRYRRPHDIGLPKLAGTGRACMTSLLTLYFE